jgi:hypothetical protein
MQFGVLPVDCLATIDAFEMPIVAPFLSYRCKQKMKPTSTHPISCFKDFITGELLHHWHLSMPTDEFSKITSLFIQCLLIIAMSKKQQR